MLIKPSKHIRQFAEKHFTVEAVVPGDVKALSGKVDAVIEASDDPEAVSSAVKIVKKGGRMAVAGVYVPKRI